MAGPDGPEELTPEQRAKNRRSSCLALFVLVMIAALAAVSTLVAGLERG